MDAQEADAFVNVSASFVLLSEILRMLFWGEKKEGEKKKSSLNLRLLAVLLDRYIVLYS